jgi:cytochrome c5
MFRRVGLLAALAATACCSKSEVKGGGSATGDGTRFTLFALAEMRGQIGPCGCTSDPLGDISRTVKLIEAARGGGPVLVLDAGSLLYSQSPIPAHLAAQEELKADLLARTYRDKLKVGAVGLGPMDLLKGAAGVRFAREVVNLPKGDLPIAPPRVLDVGRVKVGVFGVIAEDTLPALEVTDPVAAGKQAIADLKKDGAQVVVALVQAASKKDAVKLVRDLPGVDIAIAGLGLAAPEPEHVESEPTKVGDAWLVIPANRGQVISRVEVTVRGTGPLADAGGAAAAAEKIAFLEKEVHQLDSDLPAMDADPSADKAFVKAKHDQRDRDAKQIVELRANPLQKPASGSYFTLEQTKINKALACDVEVQSSVTQFYRAAGEVNAKAAAGQPPPDAKGGATYVGNATCDDCHSDAVEFWNKTRHTHAWQTLVDRGQQLDLDCIGCHVTGWDKPGGSNLANNDKLRDVQCETCHGPASIHVAKGGEEKPPAIIRTPPDGLCATQCHTKEHSDTFDHGAYLRDIVGPGHGEDLRKQMGDGPTGAQLRKAALDKAGRSLGAGCVR